jgi:hypothetical protein
MRVIQCTVDLVWFLNVCLCYLYSCCDPFEHTLRAITGCRSLICMQELSPCCKHRVHMRWSCGNLGPTVKEWQAHANTQIMIGAH